MSLHSPPAIAEPPRPPDDSAPTARGGRRRPVGSRPGWSLLAQGEPMIWLTGGALVICLSMIVGLMSWVVYRGVGTFWPTAVVQVELADGTSYMGEISREETFTLSADMVDGMAEPIAEKARELLAADPRPRVSRRLFRTGNYELTQTNFHWVNDFAIMPSGETEPEWAIVAERLSNGRFYGMPVDFVEHRPREIDEHEERLANILTFFESSIYQLDGDQQTEIRQRLESQASKLDELRQRLDDLRKSSISKFIQGMPGNDKDEALDRRAVLDSGETVPLTDVSPEQLVIEARLVHKGPNAAWTGFEKQHDEVRSRFHLAERMQKRDGGRIADQMNEARLEVRQAELDYGVSALAAAEEMERLQTQIELLEIAKAEVADRVEQIAAETGNGSELAEIGERMGQLLAQRIDAELASPRDRLEVLQSEIAELPKPVQQIVTHFLTTMHEAQIENVKLQERIGELREANRRYELLVKTVDGTSTSLPLDEVVRAYPANQLGLGEKLGVYVSRWTEFLTDEPRDANNAGGVFPAIWGTVAMTLIMAILVVPFGVLAALYLREYAKGNLIISIIRISINNLAGVPSIVFGVFGFSFFCYTVGAYIDRGPAGADIAAWPAKIWFIALFALAITGTFAFVLGLSSLTSRAGEHRIVFRWLRRGSFLAWITCFTLAVLLIAKTPFFHGFYEAQATYGPKFGTGGLAWASLTLALLTLPVVIVATEEALSAVPNSLREGSYACGAGKWQTIRRIILPHAMPGIMTGMILAMARGAGEVAPLMLVGAVKIAPELPVDLAAPFVHLERSFMHLGFHIFDLGFQSQNSEAAQPVMFTTTLLLLAIIAALNVSAIGLRARLRRRFQASQF